MVVFETSVKDFYANLDIEKDEDERPVGFTIQVENRLIKMSKVELCNILEIDNDGTEVIYLGKSKIVKN